MNIPAADYSTCIDNTITPLEDEMNLLWHSRPVLRKDCACSSALPSACSWLAALRLSSAKNVRQLDSPAMSIKTILQWWWFFPFLFWKFLEVSLVAKHNHIHEADIHFGTKLVMENSSSQSLGKKQACECTI